MRKAAGPLGGTCSKYSCSAGPAQAKAVVLTRLGHPLCSRNAAMAPRHAGVGLLLALAACGFAHAQITQPPLPPSQLAELTDLVLAGNASTADLLALMSLSASDDAACAAFQVAATRRCSRSSYRHCAWQHMHAVVHAAVGPSCEHVQGMHMRDSVCEAALTFSDLRFAHES